MMRFSFTVALLGTALVTGAVSAQTSVGISNGSGTAGGTVQVTTQLTSPGDVFGWSWGVCHDSNVVDLVAVAQGTDTQPINGGSGPDFYSVMTFPGEGWTVGVLVSFLFDDVLAAGSNMEMDEATYFLNQEGSATLCFCDTLMPGADPVQTLVVVGSDGSSEVPAQICGSITVGERYTFGAPDVAGTYDPATGIGSVVVSPTIVEDSGAPGFPSLTSAFSMGLSHDPAILTVASVVQAPLLAGLDGGTGSDFFAPALYPNGFTVGVVYDLFGTIQIEFSSAMAVLDVTYDTVPAALIGDFDGAAADVTWTDVLGDPVVPNLLIDASNMSFNPLFENGVVTLVPPQTGGEFLRGDFDASGGLGLTDCIAMLGFLFVPGSAAPTCADAIDVNDDGSQSLPDPVALLNFLFVPGSATPAAPFPDCGVDPTDDDSFDCAAFAACP